MATVAEIAHARHSHVRKVFERTAKTCMLTAKVARAGSVVAAALARAIPRRRHDLGLAHVVYAREANEVRSPALHDVFALYVTQHFCIKAKSRSLDRLD